MDWGGRQVLARSHAIRWRAALIVGCIAVIGALLLPAGASAALGEWVEAEDVTETSATIDLYLHPRWPETTWVLDFGVAGDFPKQSPCPTKEPERCDEHWGAIFQERTGVIVSKSPYEMVEIEVPIPGPLFELPLEPAKAYEFIVYTTGQGEPWGPEFGEHHSWYEFLETPGAYGPEEQANKAKIEKERTKLAKRAAKERKKREAAERKLAKLQARSERTH
jgi:hypothetical protein